MIVRTEAVVLRGIKYGETSRIVTLFTREKGKLTVMAKGARLPKSKFGATLEPTAYTQVVFYYKSTRGLQTLSESAHVEPFLNLHRDLERLTLGLRIVELVDVLMQKEDAQPHVFNLVVQTLRRLNEAPQRAANVLPYFQLRLAAALGFAPQVEREAVERLPREGGRLLLDSGAPVPPHSDDAPPAAAERRASRAALRAWAVFVRAALDDVMRMRLTPALRREVQALTDGYLRHHVQEAYPLRSSEVIARLFDASSAPPARDRRS